MINIISAAKSKQLVFSEGQGEYLAEGVAFDSFTVGQQDNGVVVSELAQNLAANTAGRAKIRNNTFFTAADSYFQKTAVAVFDRFCSRDALGTHCW